MLVNTMTLLLVLMNYNLIEHYYSRPQIAQLGHKIHIFAWFNSRNDFIFTSNQHLLYEYGNSRNSTCINTEIQKNSL